MYWVYVLGIYIGKCDIYIGHMSYGDGICIGYIYWVYVLGIYIGYTYCVYVLGIYIGYMYWVYVLGVCIGYMCWVTECRSGTCVCVCEWVREGGLKV
jgi:hypothetical protein